VDGFPESHKFKYEFLIAAIKGVINSWADLADAFKNLIPDVLK
jgi:hypothetical protein